MRSIPKETVRQACPIELFYASMLPEEVESLQNYFKILSKADPRESGYDPGILARLSNAVQNIFTLTVASKFNGKMPDTLSAFEFLADRCSPMFLSFVVKLNLGADDIPFDQSAANGIWTRLPRNIGKLKNLRYLYLNNQPIEDLAPLSSLEMNFACMEGTRVTDVSPLNFKRLGWLNLRDTPMKDLSVLAERGHSLGIIPLERTSAEDPSQIASLTKLSACTDIWLDGCAVLKDLPAELGPFVKTKNDTAYEIVDGKIKKERTANMLRPIHYMDTDHLDFV